MDRRQVFQVAAGTALAHGLVTVLACHAEPKSATPSSSPHAGHDPATAAAPSPVTPELARLAATASACVSAAETCLAHCIRSLASGSTMMADCAALVEQMIPICRAMASLAAMGSHHARALAALCATACAECAVECEKHAHHHDECKACAAACRETERAARALS
ncbi:MAG TPA: Csp1 family four helix bundle copper storage protein [Polyangiaceae bacterium]|nr:Csp1 family four helix bundle copper storage protein [Polyangiaceae bacterium]